MTTSISSPASSSHNFSRAFQQMCGFAAISKSTAFGDTLNQLVLHCLVTSSKEAYCRPEQVTEAIYTLAGLRLPQQRVQISIDLLIRNGQILPQANGVYGVPEATQRTIHQRIESARFLERQVSDQWQEEIVHSSPEIAPELAWQALTKYLTESFRRHGLQAAALLDPTVEVNGHGAESLTQILRKVISAHFVPAQHALAHTAISSFLAGGANRPERSAYIAQLGDGAL